AAVRSDGHLRARARGHLRRQHPQGRSIDRLAVQHLQASGAAARADRVARARVARRGRSSRRCGLPVLRQPQRRDARLLAHARRAQPQRAAVSDRVLPREAAALGPRLGRIAARICVCQHILHNATLMTRFITATLAIAAAATLAAQPPTILKVREWRTTHEKAILHELYDLVAIPNVATDAANIRRNAEALTRMFEKRRFAPEILPTAGTSPLVVAERRQPNVRRTITFYFHYDGQPVTASEWIYEPPFKPVIVAEHADSEQGRTITLDTWQDAIDPQWRIYGRSTSDDKSPIVAFLSAVEALDAANVPLTSNVRVVMEGEEEAGSPNLAAAVQKYADRIRGDALLLVDGPRHPSDRPTLNFGARGIMNAVVTVYGAAHDLHSGNYGNWAPNPALQLARLLASMKDDAGRVTIDGFYDDVAPLTAEETQAIADIPDEAPMLMKTFGFARPESPDRLELRHNLPTLNIDAVESGGGTSGQGRTIIPASATARLDLRFVKHIDPT